MGFINLMILVTCMTVTINGQFLNYLSSSFGFIPTPWSLWAMGGPGFGACFPDSGLGGTQDELLSMVSTSSATTIAATSGTTTMEGPMQQIAVLQKPSRTTKIGSSDEDQATRNDLTNSTKTLAEKFSSANSTIFSESSKKLRANNTEKRKLARKVGKKGTKSAVRLAEKGGSSSFNSTPTLTTTSGTKVIAVKDKRKQFRKATKAARTRSSSPPSSARRDDSNT